MNEGTTGIVSGDARINALVEGGMGSMQSAVDICELPARFLAHRVRSGELKAVEVLERYLDRIECDNSALNAVVSLDVDLAMQSAEAVDAAFQQGEILGPLHGVPMTLKDGNDVAGLRTTIGTPDFDRIATADGTVAARLRAAGAIIIGHTNVPPSMGDFQSANAIFGRTSNPWDAGRTPGGSSGGAAAAVAAGLTPVEFGSDLAGSIRLPAAFCGIYGLKTTEHRVPSTGFFRPPDGVPQSVRIMTALGPMARDLGDLELMLRLQAGPDGQNADVPPVPLMPSRSYTLSQLRLAVAPTLPGLPVAASIRRRVEEVAAQASDSGAKVEASLPELDWEALHALFGDLVTTITGLFSPGVTLRDEQRQLGWYFSALERRDGFLAAWESYFREYDALLLPAAMTTAFTHRDSGAPIEVDGHEMDYWSIPGLLTFCNLVGLPSLVVPAGFDEQGLPIGIQIVGPRWSEMRLLDIARALEGAGILPGFRAPSRAGARLAEPAP